MWYDVVLSGDMSKDLLHMFMVSIKEYHRDLIQHIRDKTPLCDMIPFETVLKRFVQAIMDLSINEKSVHYLNSTDIEFDPLYNSFEVRLIKECQDFTKSALEVGFKTNNLRIVYKTFNEHSTTIKSILPAKSQKEFEKTKTNIVIKFIRFILSTRMEAFAKFDIKKLESKWTKAHDADMAKHFQGDNSVFLKHFYRVIAEHKMDREKFMKYWFNSLGRDTSLLAKFYDDSLRIYNRMLKAYSARDEKIRTYKHKAGIYLPETGEEMEALSLLKIEKHVIKLVKTDQFWETKWDIESETKNRFDFSKAIKDKAFTRSMQQARKGNNFFFSSMCSSAADKETQDCSESNIDVCNEFTQLFKNIPDVEKRKSMKKSETLHSFRTSDTSRKASM